MQPVVAPQAMDLPAAIGQHLLPQAVAVAGPARGSIGFAIAGDAEDLPLRLGGIDAQRAGVLANKLRALATVDSVEFTFAAGGASAPRNGLRRIQDAQHVAAGHLADVGG